MILNNTASWSAESVADTKSLLSAITLSEFLAALIITNRIFSYTTNITRSLQCQSRDIVEAISGIDVLCDTLQSVRDDVDTHHRRWMDEIKKMCEDIGVELCIPRLCGRQQHRGNVPAGTPDEYYKRNLTVPLLGHVLMKMKSRFSIHQQSATYGLCFVAATMVLMEQAKVLQKLTSVVNYTQLTCLIQRAFGANFTAGTSNGRQSFVRQALLTRCRSLSQQHLFMPANNFFLI